ncbi:tryptophan dehydrogenase ScyB [Umezakia ovalisporum]|jgi:leucine dehydrogenase|uniref:L-tryptophan dehydrogenase n=2 Tax=Umezakia ovalisporum TaxID=75695 RepID=A0AA43GW75_9CYAN|nr:tryptophan dehydrogenase ScyB [Umezakia ovalisporum]MBI1242286.1 leucine dehydrogenase [Nostoc sp. RI_552]MDH6057542.1 tryptophan dehydrogenase ScyB [Umezakia ovalisporum FSS-43]MDH6062842.1 tryptophan dehydrogenase ScyB [Umezakia ovalisporum FSS-62]MDH6069072.1 tryptophan dehydrogenase ScyB [Umezakia ovalisporum APH033B]MDH6070710.1 tryptophan dehydrogenase ScyB [Umezakia ovalisporum CobakiLakeA]
MLLFETVREMGHEQILFCHGKNPDIKAIIAIHNTNLGPAMGATRLFPYASEEAAVKDALRLSRGMTYKAACANIPAGGGKAVIIANPDQKTDELFRAYGGFVEGLNGRFITGQDVNLTPEDVRSIRKETKYVVGVSEKSGGPAPITALGVFLGIKAAVKSHWQSQELQGLKVAVQGLGNVGKNLCRHLHEHGIKLYVTDVDPGKLEEVKQLFGATVVNPKEIYSLDVDIFSPCALGGILNHETIPLLKAQIIAGAANNQLADEQIHGQMLTQKGITYCPDYVINAGGLINVYNEMIGYNEAKAFQQVHNIYDTLIEIFKIAKQQNITTNDASKQLAENRIINAKKTKINEIAA